MTWLERIRIRIAQITRRWGTNILAVRWLPVSGASSGAQTKTVSDSNNANWNDALSTQLIAPLTKVFSDSNNANWSDAFSKGLAVTLNKVVSDALSMTDGVPGFGTLNYLLAIGCPHLGQTWLDLVTDVLGLNETASDQLVLVDSLSSGYSFLLSDNLNNWLDVLVVGYGNLFTDQIVFSDGSPVVTNSWLLTIICPHLNNWLDVVSTVLTAGGLLTLVVSDNLNNWLDSLLIGYGVLNSDQLVLVDSLSSGFGALLSDAESGNWLDSVTDALGLNETVTDSLNNWLDFILVGFGSSTSDQLVLVDSVSMGYGFLLSDGLNNWLDTLGKVLGMNESLSDNLNNWLDFLLVGFGAVTSDQLVLVDSLSSGYGFLLSDSLNNWLDVLVAQLGAGLILTDSLNNWLDFVAAGYGSATSDQLILVDSISSGFGALLSDSESANWLDSLATVLGLNETLSDSESANWLDFVLLGYGSLTSDQLVLVDSLSSGYGFLLSDNLNNWLDSVSVSVQLSLLISDNLNNWLDFVLLGFGSLMSDQLVLVDSVSMGYGFLLSDGLNNWLDVVTIVMGLAKILSDTETANWLDSLLVGYGDLISDTLTLSDQLGAGFGSAASDQMVIVDSLSSGYGFLLSDSLNNWLDLVQTVLQGTLISLTVLDNLNNWLDSLLVGFGALNSDQLVLVDSLSSGFGALLSDTMNNWLDFVQLVEGILLVVTDTEAANWLDALRIGYGNLVSDQITLSDQLLAGYGNLTSDQMVLVDSLSSGYGFLLSDSLNNWLDLVQALIGLLLSLSDTESANWLESLSVGYGMLVSDAEGNNWTDVVTINAGQPLIQLTVSDNLNNWLDFLLVGFGAATSDQLVLVDSASMGYGFLLNDNLNNWLDVLVKQLGMIESLSDNLSNWLDFVAAGFGSLMSDQLVFTDSASMGYGFLLSDSLNNWLDLVQLTTGLVETLTDSESANWLDSLFAGFGMATSDQLVILDSASTGYGLLLSDNLNSWLDSAVVSLLGSGTLTLTLSDNLNNWLDALRVGFGAATSDQLVILDSLSTGYGSLLSDSEGANWLDALTQTLDLDKILSDSDNVNWLDALAKVMELDKNLSDSLNVSDFVLLGYGNLTSDQLIMVDSLSSGFGALFSDNLSNWLDALAVGYGDVLTDVFPSMLDRLAAGYGSATSDQLVLVDSASTGYGLLLSDSLNNWLDLLVLQILSPGAFTLIVSDNLNSWLDSPRIGYGNLYNDQLVLSDFLGAGFGSSTSDQLVLVDSLSTGFGALFSDTLFTWNEAVTFLEGDLLLVSDSLQFSDQVSSGYGLQPSDLQFLQDNLQIGYGFVVVDNLNHWLDFALASSGTQENLLLADDFDNWLDLLLFSESTNIGPAKFFRLEIIPRSQFDRLMMNSMAKFQTLSVERRTLFYLDQSSVEIPRLMVGDSMNYWQDQFAGALV